MTPTPRKRLLAVLRLAIVLAVPGASRSYALSADATGQPQSQPTPQAAASNTGGVWSPVMQMSNVAIHAHLLPTGKVLYWGRRKTPGDMSFPSLNEHETFPFLWDPATKTSTPTPQPEDDQGNKINLFCSSHTFLADGRLMVVGGHLFDSEGIKQSTIYDPATNSWRPEPLMNEGRWYPTAVTLSDGSVLVCSGSFAKSVAMPPPNNQPTQINFIPQVWNNTPWMPLTSNLDLPLYPRMHLAPDGRVFMSGTNAESSFLDTRHPGTWTKSSSRSAGNRDYCPSIMYDAGKIIYIGGGNDFGTNLPTNIVEVIDLNQQAPSWRTVKPMHFRRRQHNGTLLPDGTVLVTGGTQGPGFNDLTIGSPIRAAELWDPVSEQWTILAEEARDRCYHSTAVLLPDATVLSAGGGEYQPTSALEPNDPKQSHADAQIFSPPYLFKGPRPVITSAPNTIKYNQPFDVGTPTPGQIKRVSLVRLSSVTHSFDQNQRINFLEPTPKANAITVTAPPNANVCPPGHYMLFLLNESLVPSVARIIKIEGQPAAAATRAVQIATNMMSPAEMDAAIVARAKRPPVVVGLTATCPYGLAACWGGASAALRKLSGVETVRPVADARDSVAYLYLDNDGLPDVEHWPAEFARTANGSYGWRGVEVTLQGTIEQGAGQLILAADQNRPAVALAPLQPDAKVQLDRENRTPRSLPDEEQFAYKYLAERKQTAPGPMQVTVTGPLKKTDAGFVLQVRQFK